MRSGKWLLTVSVVLLLGCGGSDSLQFGSVPDGSATESDARGDAVADRSVGHDSSVADVGSPDGATDARILDSAAPGDSGNAGQDAGGDGSTAGIGDSGEAGIGTGNDAAGGTSGGGPAHAASDDSCLWDSVGRAADPPENGRR